MAKSPDDRPRSAGELVNGAARALGAELPPRVAMLIDAVRTEDSYQRLLAQGIDRAISELGLDAEKVQSAPDLMDRDCADSPMRVLT